MLRVLGQLAVRVPRVPQRHVVRAAAREGKFKINEDMLSLAGATREAMGRMLLDLGCVVVGEEAVEDPAKSTIQIFEKKRKPRVTKNKYQANTVPRSSDANRRVRAGRSNSRSKAKVASSGPRGTHKASSKHAAKLNPDSPFAVLAGLKLKK